MSKLSAEEAQEAARALYRRSVESGNPLTYRELGDRFERSESWGRDRAREVKSEPEIVGLVADSEPTIDRQSEPVLPQAGEKSTDNRPTIGTGLPPVTASPVLSPPMHPSEPPAGAFDPAGEARAFEWGRQIGAEEARAERSVPERVEAAARQRGFLDRVRDFTSRESLGTAVVWFIYLAVYQVAAYGLMVVLEELVGLPQAGAVAGAVGCELVALLLHVQAGYARLRGERPKVVNLLHGASALAAVAIAIANAAGHAYLPEPEMAAGVMYAVASVAGYALVSVRTWLAHRGRERDAGRLEGPGAPIPAYVTARYGGDVSKWANLLTSYDSRLSVMDAVERARIEIDQQEAEERAQARADDLREGMTAYAKAINGDDLAARLDDLAYNVDDLSESYRASADEHASRAAEMRSWVTSKRKRN